jgi:hypothetical protein
MSFLLYISGLILIGSVAWLVVVPFFRPRQDTLAPVEPDNQQNLLERWERQKKEAYAAIKEAEFDRQTGKLTEEDYDFLRNKYEARALEALTQLDQPQQEEAGQREAGQEAAQPTVAAQQPVLPSES